MDSVYSLIDKMQPCQIIFISKGRGDRRIIRYFLQASKTNSWKTEVKKADNDWLLIRIK